MLPINTNNLEIPKDVLIRLSVIHNKECMICGKKNINEELYGLLYQLDDVVVHYFCMLLSSSVGLNGNADEGIFGFLLRNLKTQIHRGYKEKCLYCNKTGATISCSEKTCPIKFHLPCGLNNGSTHQYFGLFKSFCRKHREIQSVDMAEIQGNNVVKCVICVKEISTCPTLTTLWAPCCNAWLHRDCVQSMALKVNMVFKCPICNDVSLFQKRMLKHGIYIPKRNYNSDVNIRVGCRATYCLCPYTTGRLFNDDTFWNIIKCHSCGVNGTHKLCSSIKDNFWSCGICVEVTEFDSTKRSRIDTTNYTSSSSSTSGESSFRRDGTSRENSREVLRSIGTTHSNVEVTTRLGNSSINTSTPQETNHNLHSSDLQVDAQNIYQLLNDLTLNDVIEVLRDINQQIDGNLSTLCMHIVELLSDDSPRTRRLKLKIVEVHNSRQARYLIQQNQPTDQSIVNTTVQSHNVTSIGIFDTLPFYKTVNTLLSPFHGMIRDKDNVFYFEKLIDVSSVIKNSGNFLRCQTQAVLRFKNLCQSNIEHRLPNNLNISVNNQNIKLPELRPPPPSHGIHFWRLNIPIDLTEEILLSKNNRSMLKITWSNDPCLFLVGLFIVKKITLIELIDKLKKRPLKKTKEYIKECLTKDDDGIDSLILTVKDPISLTRMILPARGLCCKHLQCFDAIQFVRMNEEAQRWICPLCKDKVNFENIEVDEFFLNIFKNSYLSNECEKIVLYEDGSWTEYVSKPINRNQSHLKHINNSEIRINMEMHTNPPL